MMEPVKIIREPGQPDLFPAANAGKTTAKAKAGRKRAGAKAKGEDAKRLGRISVLGPQAVWHAAFLLPQHWQDFRNPITRFDHLRPGDDVLTLYGRVAGDLRVQTTPPPPRLKFELQGQDGARIGVSIFGDTRKEEQMITDSGGHVLISGKVVEYHGRLYLRNATVSDPQWLGRLMPVYRGKTSVIGANTVRDRVAGLLPEAVPVAAAWMRKAFEAYGDERSLLRIAGSSLSSLDELLRVAHNPGDVNAGRAAHAALERLAALRLLDRARASQPAAVAGAGVAVREYAKERARALPFLLSRDQQKAVREIIADVGSDVPMRRFLSGDVGTGKTAVFTVVAAGVVDAGRRAYIMLPSTVLAEQVAAFVRQNWPDLPCQCLTGGARKTEIPEDEPLLLVGTTALLHRKIVPPALLVVDEQHRFSRLQREQLVGESTHVLEATATCVPRSQALVQYGVVCVSRLHESHVKKYIATAIWERSDRAKLFEAVRGTIAAGQQVLVLYPKRGDEPDSDKEASAADQRKAAVHVQALWEKLYPGQVALVHGAQTNEEKAASLTRMKNGEASVLVATTVVEVGVDLPGLRRVVVVHADRFGLSALHQIRGRVARTGGQGWCDLYLPDAVADKALERLSVLCDTQDGFAVATQDLKQRGFGDLSSKSERQKGATAASFLFGHEMSPDVVDSVIKTVEE